MIKPKQSDKTFIAAALRNKTECAFSTHLPSHSPPSSAARRSLRTKERPVSGSPAGRPTEAFNANELPRPDAATPDYEAAHPGPRAGLGWATPAQRRVLQLGGARVQSVRGGIVSGNPPVRFLGLGLVLDLGALLGRRRDA